jgi:hypothetical protein
MLNHISGALKPRRVILVGTWYYFTQRYAMERD